ncbi:signal peptidase I [Nocardioidaceae bacterium]|nr:signal peptidase I [Nocardioidaceae bacterium]
MAAETSSSRTQGGSRPRRRGPVAVLTETAVLVVIAVVLAALIKAFLVQAFYVPSQSMAPTLAPNDRILVEKPSYWAGDPDHGDIVVFADPGGWLGQLPEQTTAQKALSAIGLLPTGGHLVKRVIATGGETIACCDPDGRLLRDGVPVDEPYLPAGTRPSAIEFRATVPEGYLWVMGDNRSDSEDSRFHQDDPGQGFVPVDSVVGNTFVIVWPVKRWDWLGF